MKKVDEKIEPYGYTSRADFCKQAIRRELERLRGVSNEPRQLS